MKSLAFPGEALRERRVELGLSLQEVHEQIHVPLQHIVAMENGDVRALPVPAYTTGFIVSYCECLGLAPYRFLDRYQMMLDEPETSTRQQAKPVAVSRTFTLPALPNHRPPWMADAITWGAICGIVLLGWMTYSVVLKPAAQEESRIEAGTMEIEMPEFHFLEDELP